jgi:sugar lactone lactonase YvrE
MSSTRAEVVFPTPSTLGEGSFWDTDRQCLYWVDIYQSKVFCFDPKRGANLAFDVAAHVGTVVPTECGRLLVALRSELALLDPKNGRVTSLGSPTIVPSGMRFNDGKCDPRGRLWVGTMIEQGEPGRAALYCIEPDLSATEKLAGLTISNGLCWSDRRFYHIDTPSHVVRVFDFDQAGAEISGGRTLIRFEPEAGAPDGMCLDAEGMPWVALWGGRAVVRIHPESGEILFKVELPVSNVTSCAFGGPDLNQLYITTARSGLSPERLESEPLAGSLFCAELPFRGATAPGFARSFDPMTLASLRIR